jgi:glutathione S-transferase
LAARCSEQRPASPQYNPLEKLPVLILEDGSSVYEPNYILQYLELKYPETPMLPPDADGILAARRLMASAMRSCSRSSSVCARPNSFDTRPHNQIEET